MNRIVVWAFLTIVLLFIKSTSAASFDCAKDLSSVENLICTNTELSMLDEQYAVTYAQALKAATNKNEFKQNATTWLRDVRNVCQDTACLTRAYLTQTEAIERPSTYFSPPSVSLSSLSETEQKQIVKLAIWGVVGGLVFLIALGLTNRVVIFYNTADAWWSISPFLFLITAIIIAATLAPEDSKAFAATRIEQVVLLGGGLGAIWGIFMTFYNAIRYNRNIFLGILVGTCKVIVSLLMAITFIGSLSNIFDSKKSAREVFLFSFLIMLIGILWTALVNGERVYRKKGWNTAG